MDEDKDYCSEKVSFQEISLDERVCELLPSAGSVESGVERVFGFWLFLETNFSGFERVGTFY